MFTKCHDGQKLAWYRNENIRFDIDYIAIENDIQ